MHNIFHLLVGAEVSNLSVFSDSIQIWPIDNAEMDNNEMNDNHDINNGAASFGKFCYIFTVTVHVIQNNINNFILILSYFYVCRKMGPTF